MLTKAGLLWQLSQAAIDPDRENAHMKVDRALIEFIDDPDITAAWEAAKWGKGDAGGWWYA